MNKLFRWIKHIVTRSTTSNPAQWFVDWISGGKSSASGIAINEDKALTYTPFWAAVRIISGDVGAIPLLTYRRIADGKERADNHAVYDLLHEHPNPYMDALTFKEVLTAHCLVWGGGFAEIQRNGAGKPYALWPLLPDRTRREITESGLPYYRVRQQGQPDKFLADENILHIKGLGFDGLNGYGVVQYHKEALGLGMAVKEYGARYFGNGATPVGLLEHPASLKAQTAKALREQFEGIYSGLENAHRVAILEEGMKWVAMNFKPQEAQCLETQKYSVDDISRIFNIPPHKLGSMDRATFSNIEQQSLDYLTQTLYYWLRKWEQECTYKLFSPTERKSYFCEFLTDALLRGDTLSRYQAYQTGRQAGFLSINDIRRKENMNSIGPNGDTYLEPVNMVPAGTLPLNQKRHNEPKPKKDEDEPDNPDDKRAIREAHRQLLLNICERVCRKEDFVAKNAAKKATDLPKFYEGHKDFVLTVLSPAVRAYIAAVGRTINDDDLRNYILRTMWDYLLEDDIVNIEPQYIDVVIKSRAERQRQWADKIIADWS